MLPNVSAPQNGQDMFIVAIVSHLEAIIKLVEISISPRSRTLQQRHRQVVNGRIANNAYRLNFRHPREPAST